MSVRFKKLMKGNFLNRIGVITNKTKLTLRAASGGGFAISIIAK